MTYFCTKNVVSIASCVEDEETRKAILLSDNVRSETLKRLCAMPSYSCKSLKWKNIYYDYFKKKVIAELSAETEV